MDCLLAKILNYRSYADDFLRGKLYINPLVSFGIGNLITPRKDMSNKHRGDLNEGLNTVLPNIHSKHGFFKEVQGMPDDIDTIGELDSRFLFQHTMSLFAIHFDMQSGTYRPPDRRMLDFDEKGLGATVVITKPAEFLVRVFSVLCRNMGSPFWAGYGLVRYVPKAGAFGDRDEFTKTDEYSWQNEFRIAINVGPTVFSSKTQEIGYDQNNDALLIDIGDISDIAFIVNTEQFISLSFPEVHRSILNTQPEHVLPFYPPVKNYHSFSYPVFRWNNMLFLSQSSLYPIKRDRRCYVINTIFASRMAELNHSDENLLKIAHMYFSRLLDLYKHPFDHDEISALLTAIVQYMFILRVKNLADVKLEISEDSIQPLFQGLELTDKSLLEKDLTYHKYSRTNKAWRPSAFAELAALSDDNVFPEYEYQGEKYCRIVVNQDAVLSSGEFVKKGEPVWVKVTKIAWFVVPE